MKVIWEVDDGYCGKSAPQTTIIDDDELADIPPNEVDDYINECVQDDFEQKISWYITKTEE